VGSSPTFGTPSAARLRGRSPRAAFRGSRLVSEEIYHLQVQGERRGPYTLRQIDHQLNSGLIGEDTLYVREGMEDWAPVTNIVVRRKKRRRGWKFRGALLAFLCFMVVLARFFLPGVLETWRELSQFQYTERAAYWRSRDAVRHQALPPATVIRFGTFQEARVALDPDTAGATVRLPGEVTEQGGGKHVHSWQVALVFDHEKKLWTATSVVEEGR
jgi:DNA-binding transcriptional regulator of glucitol operon